MRLCVYRLLICPKKPLPLHHDQQNSHINVIIDESGNFLSVIVDTVSIVLPATEDSAGRTSKIAPHAFADNLQYVAADCRNYVPDMEEKKKNRKKERLKKCFDRYVEQLESWCDSRYRHESVVAVLRYVKRRTLVNDLLRNNVLYFDSENCLNVKFNKTIVKENPIVKEYPLLKTSYDK